MRNDTELNITPSEFGLSSGLFFIGYAIAQLPAVHMAQRFGARRVLACLLLAWGAVSTSLCFITSMPGGMSGVLGFQGANLGRFSTICLVLNCHARCLASSGQEGLSL